MNETKNWWGLGTAVGVLFIGILSLSSLVETLDSTEEMVIQYPTGTLVAVTEPGWTMQWFGTVTKYKLRDQYQFDPADTTGDPLRLRFNDGGHANVSGVVSWEMPTDHENLITIHRKFGSQKAVESAVIRPTLESAAYTSGPLMSSTESAAEKRNMLLQYMQDQAKNGPYQTRTVAIKIPDPITGIEKTVNAAEIVVENGKPVRETGSTVGQFGINLLPMTINEIKYDDAIEQQIRQRQISIQGVQIAQANALKAEQDAITAAKTGEANAATEKWKQEAVKAQQVTLAQQELEVAQLKAKKAEQLKQEQILLGQGIAERKKLEMSANGALDAKLEAYVQIQKAYADAIATYKGAWVPAYVSGNGNSTAGSGAAQLIDMLSAKTAKELAIDLTVQKQ